MHDRPTNLPFAWTDEAVETLKRLWKEGLSASVIAAEMGNGLTRNSIVGKVHRLGLPSRRTVVGHFAPNGLRDVEGKARTAKARKAARPKPTPKVEAPPAFEPTPQPEEELGNDVTSLLGIMDLTNDTCRYMHGDPKGQHGYCGKQTKAGSSWCAHHHAVVFPGGRP